MSTTATPLLPAVSHLIIPEGGEPYLQGSRCGQCQAVFVGAREVCSACGARNQMEPFALANEGELYVFSIVHRSFPGIEVPYVSAVVDLDGGGTVKGNLIGIDPDPEKIKMGMRIKTVFDKTDRKDAEGNEYLAYFFEPA